MMPDKDRMIRNMSSKKSRTVPEHGKHKSALAGWDSLGESPKRRKAHTLQFQVALLNILEDLEEARQELEAHSRKLEQEVKERTQELIQANRELKTLNRKLESKVAERTRELQKSYWKLQRIFKETALALAATIERRDPYTAGHQRRVSQLAGAIARKMGLPPENISGLQIAAVVHDIGKIIVPADILNKPGSLTRIEFSLIKQHARAGSDILQTIEFPWPVARIILQHHERINGSGYPSGLHGKDLLLEAKIIAVSDVAEAMASHRPYRPSLGTAKALEEISRNSGILYDPDVAKACVEIFAKDHFCFDPDPRASSRSNNSFRPLLLSL